MNRKNLRFFKKPVKSVFVFVLVLAWFISHRSQIWPLGGFDKLTTSELGVNKIRIPPKIKEARTAPANSVPSPIDNEILSLRQENSKTYDLGSGKRALEAFIGAIHYKDNYADVSEQWKDIDLTWEGNRITRAPYELTVEGKKITVRDKKTGDVSTIELLEIGGKSVTAPVYSFSKGLARAGGIAQDTDLELVASNTGVRFTRILKSDKAPTEAKFRVAGDIPLRPRAEGVKGELPIKFALKDGILTERLDSPGHSVKQLVRIDPVLDLQVGASADDAWEWDTGGNFNGTQLNCIMHANTAYNGRYICGNRFTNITIPQGATIISASFEVYSYGTSTDDPNIEIFANDVDNANDFSTEADVDGRAKTTAVVEWIATGIGTGWKTSPDITSVIQEVIDRPGWASGNALVVLGDGKSDYYSPFAGRSWDESSHVLGPKLHITYSIYTNKVIVPWFLFDGGSARYAPDAGDLGDEGPPVLDDYGSPVEKCERWACTGWSYGNYYKDKYCQGYWDCTTWNGEVCDQMSCTSWAEEANSYQIRYCDIWDCTTWNGDVCDQWACTSWQLGAQGYYNVCTGDWDCTTWNGNNCDTWDCLGWSSTYYTDYYCSGAWDCTTWNGDKCDKWHCTAWTIPPGSDYYYDYYCSGAWDCTSWNGDVCDQWACTTWTKAASGYKDYYCSGAWDCTTWNGNSCDQWACSAFSGGDNYRDYYCSGAWDCTSWKSMIPTITQSAYRWFNNADSTDVGSPLAAQDTAATLGSVGAAFRLRMLLHVDTAQLAISGENFKLQFAQQSGTCDTAFSGETYADVTAATVIAYNNNATPADGDNLTANANDPTHGADTIVNQDYEELNNFTNTVAAIPAGQDGKWDFALKDNGASGSTAYCLRAVKSNGTVLDTYTVIPEITTATPNSAPNSPSSLAQKKTDDTVLSTGDWTNETSVKFTASASDPDSSDTLYLCVEKDTLGTSFSNSEDQCGSGVSYSGSPVTVTVTIADLTSSSWWDPNWSRRRKITFDNSGQTENLTNFPVLVKLNSSRIDYSYTQSAGQDLRFVDSDNSTALNHEIEEFNETGNDWVWVKVPQIDGSSSTDYIWMYYGNSSASAPPSTWAEGVWNSNYQAVWHLNESSGTRYDSTGNDNDLSAYGTGGVGQDSTGQMGSAADFEQTESDYLSITDALQTGLDLANSDYTFEFWVSFESSPYGDMGFIEKYDSTHEDGDFYRIASTWNGGVSSDCLFGEHSDSWSVDTEYSSFCASGSSTATWYYHAVIFDDSADEIVYCRGSSCDAADTMSQTTDGSTNDFRLGFRDGLGQYLDGQMDEVRIMSIERSTDWIAAQYDSMNDSFNTFGGEESYTSEYHWQARVKDAASAYSAWVSYGGNAESARDFGVDTTDPTGGAVYDGTEVGVDKDFNDASLSSLSANWSGFDASVSGLNYYEYSIGTTQGGTDVKGWTNNATTTSVTTTGLTLQTSKVYYFNVRAVDNAGSTQSPVISSDGQIVTPSISFSATPTSVTFNNLNEANSYNDTETSTLTTSTNAYGGYVVRVFATDYLRSADTTFTIQDFDGGTYASPDQWLTGDRGLGYNSSDTTIQGSNKFNSTPCPGGGNPPCYAPFSQTAPGDILADHTDTVSGSPITNEQFTITYQVKTNNTQAASLYVTTVVYTITAIY